LRGKRFSLLWRGSRDGFGARDFHVRCDGHAPTLSVILDTDGNVFGGFTPVAWDSFSGWKADRSLKSFVFTLKNTHNIAARRFVLKAEEKHHAICCDSESGPRFGFGYLGEVDVCVVLGCDIAVSDHCNTSTNSFTYLGQSYANDTGLTGDKVLTGSFHFRAKEVEVFEITE
jgi:hypothetical protein